MDGQTHKHKHNWTLKYFYTISFCTYFVTPSDSVNYLSFAKSMVNFFYPCFAKRSFVGNLKLFLTSYFFVFVFDLDFVIKPTQIFDSKLNFRQN